MRGLFIVISVIPKLLSALNEHINPAFSSSETISETIHPRDAVLLLCNEEQTLGYVWNTALEKVT